MPNLLPNPTFVANVAGWGTTQGALSHQAGAGQDGNGFLRYVSSVAGNANFQQAPPTACAPGDVFSVEGYMRLAAGTARSVSIMVQFLNASSVQTGNVIGSLVLATGAWQKVSSLNAVAPAGTTQARVQVRINAAAINDAIDFDNAWLNAGATIDRGAEPAPGAVTVWDGASELPATLTVWDGATAQPATT